MLHLTEYVKWRGDITFDEKPLNIIDNLVLCQLSYLDMRSAWTDDISEMTLREAVERLNGKYEYKLAFSSADDDDFTRACAASSRFGSLKMSDYMDVVSASRNEQFAAVTFHIYDDAAMIVYRGTDDTIVGWKEDFMISYMRVPSQVEALRYAERIAAKTTRCFIAGHSKGANLALYASVFMNEEYKNRIERIFLNDGPGFCPDILPADQVESIKYKVVHITPEFCVVGEIFEVDVPQKYIVKSSGEMLMQHDLHTWGIEDGALMLTETHDPMSERVSNIFDKFIEKMDMYNREEFVNRIFDTMSGNGAVTIKDFTQEGITSFENLFVRTVGWSEFNSNPVKEIGDSVINDIKESRKVKPIRENIIARKLIRIGVCVACGILAVLLPDYFMVWFFSALLLLVLIFELFQTIKHLKESNWNLKKEKLRVYLSIVLLAAYVLLHVKEGALFILASGTFGINFIFISVQLFIQFRNSKGNKLKRFRYIFECIVSMVNGVYVLLVPEISDRWYMLSSGLFLILDAFIETISLLTNLNHYLKKDK